MQRAPVAAGAQGESGALFGPPFLASGTFLNGGIPDARGVA